MTADLLAAGNLVRPRGSSVHTARPLFQLLLDDSQTCSCHVMRADQVCSGTSAMRVRTDEYERPDRIWL